MPLSTKGGPFRVLLIAADKRARESMGIALNEAGHRVLASDHLLDPSDVLQLRPDLVLLDIASRVEGVGWHYVRKLRSLPCTAWLPILVCAPRYPRGSQLDGMDGPRVLSILRRPFERRYFLDAVECAGRNQLSAERPALYETEPLRDHHQYGHVPAHAPPTLEQQPRRK